MPSFGEWGFIVASRRPFRTADGAAAGPALPRPSPACRRCSTSRPTWRACRPRSTGSRTRCWCRPSRTSGARCSGERAWPRAREARADARATSSPPRRSPRRAARRPARATTRARWQGGWVGADAERGHLLRDGWPATKSGRPAGARSDAPRVRRRRRRHRRARRGARAAARRHRRLRTSSSSRTAPAATAAATRSAACACPLGAHYLPVPGERRDRGDRAARRARRCAAASPAAPVYDERMLCHSPQERLFIDGGWHDGLLPPIEALPAAERAPTLAGYRALRRRGRRLRATAARFAIPTARARWSRCARRARRASPSRTGSTREGLAAPALRWYLDYCCRDDYGAGSGAGLGLGRAALLREPARLSRARRRARGDERDGVLTWPEGNAWLAERLAAPLGERLQRGPRRARASTKAAHEVERRRLERRDRPARALDRARASSSPRRSSSPRDCSPRRRRRWARRPRAMRHAPWLVANLQLDTAARRPARRAAVVGQRASTAAPASAMSMRCTRALRPFAGGDGADRLLGARRRRRRGARRPAPAPARRRLAAWARAVVADLAAAHPDLPAKVRRVDLMRYGHAMSIPGSRRAQQRGVAGARRAADAACNSRMPTCRRTRCSRKRSSTARAPAALRPRPERAAATDGAAIRCGARNPVERALGPP